jgi:hypothetical protein
MAPELGVTRTNTPALPRRAETGQMSSLPSKPGSLWSLTHLLLLSKFMRARRVEPPSTDSRTDGWNVALGESQNDAIRRFASAGLLIPSPLAEKLACSFLAAHIKEMLRERGLKLSGSKNEMAERLCYADPRGIENALASIESFKCSETGRQLAEEFLEREQRMKRALLEYLQKGDCEAAVREVCNYKDALGFPTTQWFPDRPRLDDVRSALSANPRILASVSEGTLRQLRLAAAKAFLGLWSKWYLDDMETDLKMSNEVAVNMMVSSVQNGRNVAHMRLGEIKRVKILGTNLDDSCEACETLRNRVWPIDEIPELPHAACTSKCGCRCVYVADLP